MKVICKGHKTCYSKGCVHKVLHEQNTSGRHPYKCINVESSDCYCSEGQQYIRKQKLEKLNEKIL